MQLPETYTCLRPGDDNSPALNFNIYNDYAFPIKGQGIYIWANKKDESWQYIYTNIANNFSEMFTSESVKEGYNRHNANCLLIYFAEVTNELGEVVSKIREKYNTL